MHDGMGKRGTRSVKGAVVATFIAAATLSTFGLTGAGTASAAAAGCSGTGPRVTDYFGSTWNTKYCNNYQGGQVMGVNTNSGVPVGYLNAGRNWFVCQMKLGENPPVGSARNDWWLWTQADTSTADKGWGWFPATKVSGGGNYEPVPGLPVC